MSQTMCRQAGCAGWSAWQLVGADVKRLHRMVLALPTRWKQSVLGRLVGTKMIAFLVDGGMLQLAVLYVFVPQTLLWGFCACLHLAQT
jgi:hypothetical protein